ncbi:hypothetical protein [Nocardia seriolae]|uniref:Uncharacterized protein n=1 Tax=Nocardia seriolae TaxID=37332 RepID=A0A0B8NIK0_9NOCA|nr:hypothetical protein [Nocardia seriolae]APA99956.1 hypothetical protein NS506_05920 [Nocardia seriolae]MTJ64641.1 hypothetical protein [Nocardia seriolae]MTJ73048.1 hypothetical protein [Nocardia seriolae]MTJ89483.1 hypothetical protein [Nocardia seriolae]MTK33459.1 hypothetical protein [Nocardia seriolae]
MTALWTTVVGVAATLLGSLLTFYMQRAVADRATALQRAERDRQERLDAYSRFAGAAIRYRLSELTRWHRQAEAPGSSATLAAVRESHQCRATLFEALALLHVLTDDPELRIIATRIVEDTDRIHRADDADERRKRGIDAGDQIERFVRHAAADIRPGTRAGVLLPFKR